MIPTYLKPLNYFCVRIEGCAPKLKVNARNPRRGELALLMDASRSNRKGPGPVSRVVVGEYSRGIFGKIRGENEKCEGNEAITRDGQCFISLGKSRFLPAFPLSFLQGIAKFGNENIFQSRFLLKGDAARQESRFATRFVTICAKTRNVTRFDAACRKLANR